MSRKPSKEMTTLASRLTLHDVNLSVVPGTDNYLWFIQEFQRLLIASDSRGELLLPNIKDSNDNIGVFSDYGGESPNSKYLTYSFLVCALDQKDIFTKKMRELRQQTGLDSPPKEIAFKDIHYGPIKRAIKTYLTNLDNYVNGYLLTVVIEKSIRTLFDRDKKSGHEFITKTLAESGFGAWKPDVAEKILRITHFISYLIALLSKPEQKIFWMTDHDAIASTENHFMNVLKLFSQLLNHYCKHKLSGVYGSTPSKNDSEFLDLLSAPDIVAGSLEHYFTNSHRETSKTTIKDEADVVLKWLGQQGIALKKKSILFKKDGDNIICSVLEFKAQKHPENTIFVPIVV